MIRSHPCSLHVPPEKLTGAFAHDEKHEKRKKGGRGEGAGSKNIAKRKIQRGRQGKVKQQEVELGLRCCLSDWLDDERTQI